MYYLLKYVIYYYMEKLRINIWIRIKLNKKYVIMKSVYLNSIG